MIRIHRLKQVAKYGWQHAGQISKDVFGGKRRIALFGDILGCYRKYGMWSNQYLKERMWELDKSKREAVGKTYYETNKKREEWLKDFYANRKFYMKYGNIMYEKESLRAKRNEAYTKRYNAGKNLFVEHDVVISRQHYLEGTITIGDNVVLAKRSFIDYSGHVILGDNVSISDGVILESHDHPSYTKPSVGTQIVNQKTVVINDGAIIGVRVVINSSVESIGRNARVGAGAVLRHNVPPYAIVTGNPAKIVGFSMTPEQVEEYEKEHYSEDQRISIEQYDKDYNKYFLNRLDEIKQFLKK